MARILAAVPRWARAVAACPPAMRAHVGASAPYMGRLPQVQSTVAVATGVRASSTEVAASDLRVGDLIEDEAGMLWRVVKREFSRTAAGRAYIQAEIRSFEGTKRDVRYRTEDALQKASLDTPGSFTILYATDDTLSCMHQHTFEQIDLPLSALGDKASYAQEGMVLTIETYKGNPAVVTVPPKVTVLVKSMDEGGGVAVVDTALGADSGSNGISNEFKVRVPKFVKVGDKLTLDTNDGKYLGRE